jgi:hypothetical protein
LHIHDAHFIRLAFGMPTGATTRGSRRNGLPEYWHSLFEFDDNSDDSLAVQATSGAISQQGRPFLHGFEIHLEQATLVFEFAVMKTESGDDEARYLCPPTLFDAEGNAQRVDLGDGDPMNAFHAELEHVTQVIEGKAQPDVLACQLARDAIEICRMQSA